MPYDPPGELATGSASVIFRENKHAILASTLASSMVYSGDDSSVFATIVEALVKRFPQYSWLGITLFQSRR